jgi:hypothetical protein
MLASSSTRPMIGMRCRAVSSRTCIETSMGGTGWYTCTGSPYPLTRARPRSSQCTAACTAR